MEPLTRLIMIDPREILVKEDWNPRTDFSHVIEWKQTIRQVGVQQPLIVKRDVDSLEWALVSGETRLRSCLELIGEGTMFAENGTSLLRIPVLPTPDNESEQDTFIRTMLENSHTPLNPFDEAMALKRLREEYGLKLKEIVNIMGHSEQYICARLALVDAAPEVREGLETKRLGVTTATKIVREHRDDPQAQAQAVEQAPVRYSRDRAPHELPENEHSLPILLPITEVQEFLYTVLEKRGRKVQGDVLSTYIRGMLRGLELASGNGRVGEKKLTDEMHDLLLAYKDAPLEMTEGGAVEAAFLCWLWSKMGGEE